MGLCVNQRTAPSKKKQATMIRKPIKGIGRSTITIRAQYEAEPLEVKLRRKMKGGKVDEEEGDGKTWAIAYTEKKDGVKPEYDIRTDRFEIAREAMETIEKGIQLSYSDPNKATTEKTTEDADEAETR